jgi:hypothetical protein
VVNVTDPYGRILRFSRHESLLFYQVAPQLYSRGRVHPVTTTTTTTNFIIFLKYILYFSGVSANHLDLVNVFIPNQE